MNFGVDIDGVLTDICSYQLEKGIPFFKEKYHKDVINSKGFDIQEIFGCSKEERYDFWKQHLLKYAIAEPARPGMAYALQKQVNDGDTITIITSREFADQNGPLGTLMRTIVKEWLKANHIPYQNIVFTSGSKREAIQKNHIDVMMEDDPRNIRDIEDLCTVLCYDSAYNKDEHFSENVIHISSPYQIYDVMQSIKYPVRDEIKPLSGIPSVDQLWRKYYNDKQKSVTVPELTIYQYLKEQNKNNLDAIALEYFGKTMTFREMFQEIENIAQRFRQEGVKKGDIVSLCMPNTPEAVTTFYALNEIGAIADMIHPLSGQKELKEYLQSAKSKYLVMIDIDYKKVQPILDETSVQKAIVVSAADSMPFLLGHAYSLTQKDKIDWHKDIRFVPWKKWMTERDKTIVVPINDYHKDEPAVLLHTGGTSGTPKAVVLSNEAFNGNVEQLRYTIPSYKKGDSLLAVTPVFHGFGLSNCIHTPLSVNMYVSLLPQFDLKMFRNTLLRNRSNLVLGVPTLYNAMVNDIGYDGKDLSFFKVAISGGDSASKSFEDRFNDWAEGHHMPNPLFKGYGLTEALAATSFTSVNANKPSSIGVPLPMNNFKIVKPYTTEEVGYNELGEICISGPTLMQEYYQNPTETEETLFKDKRGKTWLRTGDIGYIGDDGLIYYKQRLKRVIISSGYNLYPTQIEEVINEHPDVKTCIVVAKPDERKVNVAKAFIVLNDGIEASPEILNSIQMNCREKLSKFSWPAEYEFRQKLPLTLMNKVDYHRLEEEERQNYYSKTGVSHNSEKVLKKG